MDWGDLNPHPSGDFTRNSPFLFLGAVKVADVVLGVRIYLYSPLPN